MTRNASTMQMVMYAGNERQTEVPVEVVDLGCGAGEIDCPECGGDGDWGKFLNPDQLAAVNPGGGRYDCVVCKGTGRWLISV